ncbi:hypothetical protein SCLCIDRAFT_661715 [Scleroderma citrinum Foug A]|uniref:Uncharacterized protein n=1 Tax=Scleroderma citrinum Foug A TaxID=1036808 RepID=A0A0C2ZRM8_9AGAM|nr:hypothetical protein SCLCIDRAFT_661715 [Scleroderma citrinum Foug A]
MVVLLNSPGRAAVGVAVKPPDESFCRLETACPNPPLYLSLCVLYAALILGEGRPTDMTNRLTTRDTSLRTQTIHYPPSGGSLANYTPHSYHLLLHCIVSLCINVILHENFISSSWGRLVPTLRCSCEG